MMRRLGFHQSWVEVCFLASMGAAAIHFAAARPHLLEWGPAGGFMLATGLAQVAWAVWIAVRPSDAIVAAGVALNAGIVGTWLVSRTAGLPFGPHAGMPEHIHPADALATALEVILIASALAISSDARPHRALTVMTGVGAAVAVLAGAHDPVREGLTAAAVLSMTLVARFIVGSAEPRRKYVTASITRRLLALVDTLDRAGRGTSRRADPRHRHLEQPGL